MTKSTLLVLGSTAIWAGCSSVNPTQPATAQCHALDASAFAGVAWLQEDGSVQLRVQLQGDSEDTLPSEFSYGVVSVTSGGTLQPMDDCFIEDPFGTSISDITPSTGSTSLVVNVPVGCEGGFADGTTALNVTISLSEMPDGGPVVDGGENEGMSLDCDGGVQCIPVCDGGLVPAGQALLVQVSASS